MHDRATLLGPNFVEIAAPACEGARRLHDFWQRQAAAGDLPNRDDFSFETLRQLDVLGRAFVVEPLEDGRDWRYRLLGSEITWLFGRDVTNIPFSAHFEPAEARQCIAYSNQVARERRPVFLVASFVSGGFKGQLETLSLPVWNRGRDAIWLVGASFPRFE